MHHIMGKLSYKKTTKPYWISQPTYECQFNQLTEITYCSQSLSSKKSSRKMKPLTPKSSNTTAHNYTTFHRDRTMIVTTASKYTLNTMKQDITTTFNKAFKCLSKNKLFLFLSTAVGKRCGFPQFTKKPTQGYRCIYAVADVNTGRSMQSVAIHLHLPQ